MRVPLWQNAATDARGTVVSGVPEPLAQPTVGRPVFDDPQVQAGGHYTTRATGLASSQRRLPAINLKVFADAGQGLSRTRSGGWSGTIARDIGRSKTNFPGIFLSFPRANNSLALVGWVYPSRLPWLACTLPTVSSWWRRCGVALPPQHPAARKLYISCKILTEGKCLTLSSVGYWIASSGVPDSLRYREREPLSRWNCLARIDVATYRSANC
jgi:hypothetical protein